MVTFTMKTTRRYACAHDSLRDEDVRITVSIGECRSNDVGFKNVLIQEWDLVKSVNDQLVSMNLRLDDMVYDLKSELYKARKEAKELRSQRPFMHSILWWVAKTFGV
jgi:hypothetical protein